MVKTGEVYVDDRSLPPTEFDLTGNRPRLIANPQRSTLGLPQAISSHVQHHLSKNMPEFVCGLSLKELAGLVQSHDRLDRVISIDGSSFDSN